MSQLEHAEASPLERGVSASPQSARLLSPPFLLSVTPHLARPPAKAGLPCGHFPPPPSGLLALSLEFVAMLTHGPTVPPSRLTRWPSRAGTRPSEQPTVPLSQIETNRSVLGAICRGRRVRSHSLRFWCALDPPGVCAPRSPWSAVLVLTLCAAWWPQMPPSALHTVLLPPRPLRQQGGRSMGPQGQRVLLWPPGDPNSSSVSV